MASSLVTGLSLLMMFYGCIAAKENEEEPSVSTLSRYGCAYCCSRIDNQTTILKGISYASEKLTKDVGEIKTGIVDDIPSQLDGLKTSVGTDIPLKLEKQSSELKGIKTTVDDIAINLNKHSEDLLVHHAWLKEQGLLLEKMNISSQLKKQEVDLDALKTSVGTDIPSHIDKLAKKHSEDLLVHDARLKEQGLLLGKQAVDLDAVKTSVGTNIPSQLDKLAKASVVDAITVRLNKHSEDLLVHDARLKEQGLILGQLNNLVNEIHDSLVPKDCSDIRALGRSASGVYRVYPGSLGKSIKANVYCDMTTPGGSWLVFQRRKDGSVNFERTWNEYMNGFGNPSGEFWLGNEALYLLTSNRKYKLRIDMEDFDGQKRHAEYSTFSISSSADRYRLTVGGYRGNAGDSLSTTGNGHHNGMQFSTKDSDNDAGNGSCAQTFRGAWWYRACHASNLNGLYLRGPHKSYADGIEWGSFRGHNYSLKITEMKIAAVN